MKNDHLIFDRKPNKLNGIDYSGQGYYFVTLCIKNRYYWFGVILEGRIVLNEIGEYVRNCWSDIPKHYNNKVKIDEFIVMPNHIHGILYIDSNTLINPVVTEHCSVTNKEEKNGLCMTEQCSVTTERMEKKINYGLLSKVIMSFKNVTTKYINNLNKDRSFFGNVHFIIE